MAPIRCALLALLLVACDGERAVDPPPEPAAEPDPEPTSADGEGTVPEGLGALALGFPVSPADAEGLSVTLTAAPERVAMLTRRTVRFTLEITNAGDVPVADLPLTGRWLINGAPQSHVQMSFLNGAREGDWDSVGPGQSVRVERALGEDVLTRPGAWVMSYEHGDLRGEARVIAIADEPAERGLAWWLEADPPDISLEERGRFRLRLHVTNTGPRVREPDLTAGEFRVDSEPSTVVGMAFNNGLREAAWARLTPGQSASIERALGDALFEEPGYYEIRYRREDGTDAGVTVTVRRNREDAVAR